MSDVMMQEMDEMRIWVKKQHAKSEARVSESFKDLQLLKDEIQLLQESNAILHQAIQEQYDRHEEEVRSF